MSIRNTDSVEKYGTVSTNWKYEESILQVYPAISGEIKDNCALSWLILLN
jgi:hypothetical protein